MKTFNALRQYLYSLHKFKSFTIEMYSTAGRGESDGEPHADAKVVMEMCGRHAERAINLSVSCAKRARARDPHRTSDTGGDAFDLQLEHGRTS
jgi:hypothetical protein